MSELDELLDHYFSLGVAEGNEGRTHDTPAGEAQATRDLIMGKIQRLEREIEELDAERNHFYALAADDPGKNPPTFFKDLVGELRESNRKLHRRCQQAERVHEMTVGYLSNWLAVLRKHANGRPRPDRLLFWWAIKDLHRKANLPSRSLPEPSLRDAKERLG